VKRLIVAGAASVVGAVCLTATSILLEGCTSGTSQATDHFDGHRFYNRERFPDPTFWEEVKIAWTLRTKTKNWPDHFPTAPAELPKDPVLRGIRVLWVGHATALIQTPTLTIITDPVLFNSIGPTLFPIKTVTNPGVPLGGLPRIDVILISHNHYDHLDLKSIHAIVNHQRGSAPTVLVGIGVGDLLRKEGIASVSELDWDQPVTVKGTRFVFLEAVHTSRRGMWDTNKTLWGSFLIDSPEGRIYFAGDTAYGKHFKHVYQTYGAPKLSLLPIGAYEPRWFMYRMHMNPDEAVLAHIDLHSEHSIAIHFGLIDNAAESYTAPVDDLALARNVRGIADGDFVAPQIGQMFQYW
jgi:L-ascorbate metabolism protein UlaG (beta-lactamase superfamily)